MGVLESVPKVGDTFRIINARDKLKTQHIATLQGNTTEDFF